LVTFETTMDSRVGKHAVFSVLPFCQKPSLQGLLLLSIPIRRLRTLLRGLRRRNSLAWLRRLHQSVAWLLSKGLRRG